MPNEDRKVRVQFFRCPWEAGGERHWIVLDWGSSPAAIPCRWHGGKTDPIKLKDQDVMQGIVNAIENSQGWTEVEPLPYDEVLWRTLNDPNTMP